MIAVMVVDFQRMINLWKKSREKSMCHEVVLGMDKDINLQLDFCWKHKYSGSNCHTFYSARVGVRKASSTRQQKWTCLQTILHTCIMLFSGIIPHISHPHWLTRHRWRPFKMGKNVPQSSAVMESPELDMTSTIMTLFDAPVKIRLQLPVVAG